MMKFGNLFRISNTAISKKLERTYIMMCGSTYTQEIKANKVLVYFHQLYRLLQNHIRVD